MTDTRVLDEVYFSVDGEFDGSHPPKHSMLSVGAVAFTLRKGILGEFERNIFPNAGQRPCGPKSERAEWLDSIGLPHGHTMDKEVWDNFWVKFPDAWAAVNVDPVVPSLAMHEFKLFYEQYAKPRQGVFLDYPGGIDFSWCHWYFMEYLGEDPFGHSRSFSVKSYAAAALKRPLCHATKRNMPKAWFASKLPHTHIALDDARQQAHMAIRMMCQHLDLPLPPL